MDKRTPVNNQIRAREVRLIDETGKQLGVVALEEALKLAYERKLDLIQVTEKVEPPVTKLGDFGKYIYQKEKKERETKKHVGGELKEIRLGYNISVHDLETRAKQAVKFLERNDRVRISLPLRGRQKAMEKYAREKIEQFLSAVRITLPIKKEAEVRREPRGLSLIIMQGK